MDQTNIFNYNFRDLYKKLKSEKLCSVNFFSLFLQNEFLEKLRSCSDVTFQLINSSDITNEWIDSKVDQQSLFFEEKHFLVKWSHKVPDDLIQRLIDQDEIRCIFVAEKKKSSSEQKIIKSYSVLGPKFWEYQELIDYFCSKHGIKATHNDKEKIYNSIEKDFDIYWHFFENLSLLINAKGSATEVIDQLVHKSSHLDSFDLVDLLNQGNFKGVFLKLIDEKTFSSLEQRCLFLISHCLKLIDPSFLKDKKKLNKYERNIVNSSKRLAQHKLIKLMEVLKEVAFLSRYKNETAFIEVMKAAK